MANYWISPADKGWKAHKEGASKASGIFQTQREAENFARDLMEKPGNGGELITQNKEGVIRSKDTINSNDPLKSRDTEH